MNNLLFSLKNISFAYLGKFPALADVNIDIQAGQKITVIGANGSGKSTFLQILDGLLFADTGEIKFYGKQLSEKAFNNGKFSQEFRRKVGFVFQNPDVQLFCPTVKDDIVFGPLQLGFAKNEIEKRLEKLITVLDLSALLNRSPYQLSIGEKRKVAIASTLIIDPEVLILDEPTAGLDPLTTRHIIDLLIHENLRGKTIITATHDLHIVEEISDLVYVFNNQKTITRFGKTDVILNDIDLLKMNNLVHIHSHKHKDKMHLHPHVHLEHHTP
ncbi:MAG: energy-coupling factor ABC transporter ATP-binding protein [Candidatus Omnitrophica bacterium]|nr:energy-coupling factor ABC transporter ATP-binding protein [Candidatus Omnitrophota bacterium]